MDERELTKLWYLADAIVRAPSSWRKVFDAADGNDQLMVRPSPQLQKSIAAMRDALEKESKVTLDTVKTVAAGLLRRDGAWKDAGRALAWAFGLRLASTSRRASFRWGTQDGATMGRVNEPPRRLSQRQFSQSRRSRRRNANDSPS